MVKDPEMTFWAGKSNSHGSEHLKSMQDAIDYINSFPEPDFRIIDADNGKIYTSSMEWAERAIKSAKVNFGVEISIENVHVISKPIISLS